MFISFFSDQTGRFRGQRLVEIFNISSVQTILKKLKFAVAANNPRPRKHQI
jgi:hypothetical protein